MRHAQCLGGHTPCELKRFANDQIRRPSLVKHYERWGDEQLQLIAHETRTPAIRTVTDAARSYHRDWVARAYRARLQALPAPIRRRRLAQLTAVTDLAVWGLLRRELGLSQRQTETAIKEMVAACLATDAEANPT